MKLHLDENLPHKLRQEIPGHDCYTVAFMKWGGVKNGKLLDLAHSHGFEAMLTKDSSLQYEQDLTDLPISVVVLQAISNDIEDIRPLIPALLAQLEDLPTKQIVHISI